MKSDGLIYFRLKRHFDTWSLFLTFRFQDIFGLLGIRSTVAFFLQYDFLPTSQNFYQLKTSLILKKSPVENFGIWMYGRLRD